MTWSSRPPERVGRWSQQAPGRFIRAIEFELGVIERTIAIIEDAAFLSKEEIAKHHGK